MLCMLLHTCTDMCMCIHMCTQYARTYMHVHTCTHTLIPSAVCYTVPQVWGSAHLFALITIYRFLGSACEGWEWSTLLAQMHQPPWLGQPVRPQPGFQEQTAGMGGRLPSANVLLWASTAGSGLLIFHISKVILANSSICYRAMEASKKRGSYFWRGWGKGLE